MLDCSVGSLSGANLKGFDLSEQVSASLGDASTLVHAVEVAQLATVAVGLLSTLSGD